MKCQKLWLLIVKADSFEENVNCGEFHENAKSSKKRTKKNERIANEFFSLCNNKRDGLRKSVWLLVLPLIKKNAHKNA